jgi:hypothetical protein
MRKNCSGDEEAISNSPQSKNAENGAGETADSFSKKFQPKFFLVGRAGGRAAAREKPSF